MGNKSSFSTIINGELPVLIDFTATWCGPCQTMLPTIKEVASTLKGQVKVIKIDVDKNSQLAQNLGIRGVPTLVLFNKGQEVWRQSGVQTTQSIVNQVTQGLE